MKSSLSISCIVLLFLCGCSPKDQPAGPASSSSLANPQTLTWSRDNPAPAPPTPPFMAADQPLALVNGQPVTLGQLQRPLVEAYGLQILLHLVQLEMAKQKAKEAGVTVSPRDVLEERQRTLETMFKDSINTDGLKMTDEEKDQFRQQEYERLLQQFLQTQRISLPEFDLAMQTSAHLRKTAEPLVKDKITDEALQEAFKIKYGERIRVRHIQLANLREVAEARRRLDAGQAFETVAADMSRDQRTRRLGGEIRPFSRAERMWPQAFKDAAFALKNPGDLSDPINTADAYHLIKLEERIPPNKAVKFEDHREILRAELYNLIVAAKVKQLREELASEARNAMKIQDPALRKQYQQRLDRAAGESPRDPDQLRRELELDRPRLPSTRPATIPPGRDEVARPPATMPGD